MNGVLEYHQIQCTRIKKFTPGHVLTDMSTDRYANRQADRMVTPVYLNILWGYTENIYVAKISVNNNGNTNLVVSIASV